MSNTTKMASQPVRPTRKVRVPFKVLDKLRSLEKGQNVALECDNPTDESGGTLEATVSEDFLEFSLPMESQSTPRRTSRSRNVKSALELLGMTPKKEKSGQEGSPETKRRRTGSSQSPAQRGTASAKMSPQPKSDIHHSPSEPSETRRGRGRPRKYSVPRKEENEEEGTEIPGNSLEESHVEKRRGRPKKYGDRMKEEDVADTEENILQEEEKDERGSPMIDCVEEEDETPKQRRGRPQKLTHNGDEEKDETPMERRGRSRKLSEYNEKEKDELETGRRGRSRKLSHNDDEKKDETPKERRGRSRKLTENNDEEKDDLETRRRGKSRKHMEYNEEEEVHDEEKSGTSSKHLENDNVQKEEPVKRGRGRPKKTFRRKDETNDDILEVGGSSVVNTDNDDLTRSGQVETKGYIGRELETEEKDQLPQLGGVRTRRLSKRGKQEVVEEKDVPLNKGRGNQTVKKGKKEEVTGDEEDNEDIWSGRGRKTSENEADSPQSKQKTQVSIKGKDGGERLLLESGDKEEDSRDQDDINDEEEDSRDQDDINDEEEGTDLQSTMLDYDEVEMSEVGVIEAKSQNQSVTSPRPEIKQTLNLLKSKLKKVTVPHSSKSSQTPLPLSDKDRALSPEKVDPVPEQPTEVFDVTEIEIGDEEEARQRGETVVIQNCEDGTSKVVMVLSSKEITSQKDESQRPNSHNVPAILKRRGKQPNQPITETEIIHDESLEKESEDEEKSKPTIVIEIKDLGRHLVETTENPVVIPGGATSRDEESMIACEALSELAEGLHDQQRQIHTQHKSQLPTDEESSEVNARPEQTVVYIQPATGAPKPAVITWNVPSSDSPAAAAAQPGGQEDMEQYHVEVLKPQLTPGIRSKPKKHFVVSQRLEDMINNLEPADSINNHVNFMQGESRKKVLVCKHCDKILRDKHDFRRHIRTHKDVEYKPWKCPICPYKAAIKASIARHINIHGDIKPYVCEECGKGFNFKQKLMLHMKYHLDIRDKKCEFCGMAFHEYKTLKLHLLKIHHIKVAPKRPGSTGPTMYLSHMIKAKEEVEKSQKAEQEESDQEEVTDTSRLEENEDNRQTRNDGDLVEVVSQTLTNVKVFKKSMTRVSKLNAGKKEAQQSEQELESEEEERAPPMSSDERAPPMSSEERAPPMPVISGDGTMVWQVNSGSDISALVKALEAGEIPQESSRTHQQRAAHGGQEEMVVEVMKWPSSADENVNENVNEKAVYKEGKEGEAEEEMVTIQIEGGEITVNKSAAGIILGGNVSIQNENKTERTMQARPGRSVDINTESSRGLRDAEHGAGHSPQKETTEMEVKLEKTRSPVVSYGKKSRLFGTRKTALYTQQFKLGMLSNTSSKDNTPTIELGCDLSGMTPSKKLRRTKILTQDDLEPHLQPYMQVTPIYEIGNMKAVTIVPPAVQDPSQGDQELPKYSKVVFFCKMCDNKVFSSKTAAIGHMEKEHQEIKAWKCDICDYQCRMRTSLIVHKKLHTGIKDYTCQVCGKAFAFKQKLRNHMKYHLNLREHKCSMCERAFNEKNDLTKHIKRVHVEERNSICEICKKSFKDPAQLRRHMERHQENAGHLCQFCNKTYRSRMSLSQHMKSHTCMFHCEICSRNFGSYSGFMAHKVMHDESYSGYECPMCNKVLHTKGSLTRHKTIVHSNERKFECTTCGRRFKTTKDLKNHGIVHMSEKTFVCEVCRFSCKRAESLRVHMRRHAAIKPFQCGICGKEYTQKNALETHLKHHTGDVDNHCGLCSRDFLTKYQLMLHMKRKHMDNSAATGEEDGQPLNMDPITIPVKLTPTQAEEKSMTVFMCQECNSMFLSQDNLAVHILAEHMGKQALTLDTSQPQISVSLADMKMSRAATSVQPGTSLLLPNAHTIDTQPIEGATIEIPAMEGEEEIQDSETMETLVTVSDPTSAKPRLVSLVHPVGDSTVKEESIQIESGSIQMVREAEDLIGSQDVIVSESDTAICDMLASEDQPQGAKVEMVDGQTLTTWLDADGNQETYISVTDPTTNGQMYVAVQPSNLETLLQTSDGQATTVDGTPLTEGAYVTIEAPVHHISGDDTYVTVPAEDFGDGENLLAVPIEQEEEVAETIEIPISLDGEVITIQKDE